MIKKITLSMAMIAVTLVAVTTATVAYFTDVATNSNNTFSAGTLDIDFGEPATLPVTLTNMQPEEEQTVQFNVRNNGTLPVNLAAYAIGTWNNGNLLDDKIHVTKVEYFDGTWLPIISNDPILGVVYYSPNGLNSGLWTLAPGVTEEFRLTVKLDDTADNNYMSRTYYATINVGAKQLNSTEWPAGF